MEMHSSFLFLLFLTCWPGQLTYSKQMTIQADDKQTNLTNHENFVNRRLPGGHEEANDTTYDGEIMLPSGDKIRRYFDKFSSKRLALDSLPSHSLEI